MTVESLESPTKTFVRDYFETLVSIAYFNRRPDDSGKYTCVPVCAAAFATPINPL